MQPTAQPDTGREAAMQAFASRAGGGGGMGGGMSGGVPQGGGMPQGGEMPQSGGMPAQGQQGGQPGPETKILSKVTGKITEEEMTEVLISRLKKLNAEKAKPQQPAQPTQ